MALDVPPGLGRPHHKTLSLNLTPIAPLASLLALILVLGRSPI